MPHLELAGRLQDSLNVGVGDESVAGVGVVKETAHGVAVQSLHLHLLLVALPQTAAEHRPADQVHGKPELSLYI